MNPILTRIAGLAATLALGGCSCRVVEVVPGPALEGPERAALPPDYLRLPPAQSLREGGPYAVFDVAWTGGEETDGVQVIVESENRAEVYEPGRGEDLSLGSVEADTREVVSVYWASDNSSSWSESRLWRLPIVETGLAVGAELDSVRRRRLLENAGILLLTIDPLLQTLVPWAVDWVQERPISLYLALDSQQRSALTSRSIVRLMTSLVDMDFERATDLGYGRTRIPVRIGVPDIDFAVGQVTLFHSADGAEFTLGVESLTLNIDDQRRVELRLQGFGDGWPRGLGDRLGSGLNGRRVDWPLVLGGYLLDPSGDQLVISSGDAEVDRKLGQAGVFLRPPPGSPGDSLDRLEGLVASRFVAVSREALQVLDLEHPNADPILSVAGAKLLSLDHVETGSDRGLVSAVTVSVEEKRAPVVHVFAYDDDQVQPLARVPGPDPGDGDSVRLFQTLSPRGDAFVIPDGAFLVLLRRSGGGTSAVDRFPADEGVANFLGEGRSLLFRSKSALRLIEVATGEVLLNESGVENLIVGSENFMFRDDDGLVRVIQADGTERFRRDLGDAEPKLIDDIYELGWLVEDGVLTEIDFDDDEVERVRLDFEPDSVRQFDRLVLVRGAGENGANSFVREIESGEDNVAVWLRGEFAFGLVAEDTESFTVFTAAIVDASSEARVFARRFQGLVPGTSNELGPLDAVFGPGASGSDAQKFWQTGPFDCQVLEDDRALVQAGTKVLLCQLGDGDRWHLVMPYRARDRARPVVTDEPEWILYGRQGHTHAFAVEELARFAETLIAEPSSPLVLEAFPGLRPLAMVRSWQD
ncbi:MAG: hypothetical protein AAF196_02510 [Planctomycetota bacterium]